MRQLTEDTYVKSNASNSWPSFTIFSEYGKAIEISEGNSKAQIKALKKLRKEINYAIGELND